MTEQLWLLIVSVLLGLIGVLLLMGYNDVRERICGQAAAMTTHHALIRKFLVKMVFSMPQEKQEELLTELGNILAEKNGGTK